LLNPDTLLPCDFNSVLTCSEVAKTWQATLLNFMGTPVPNAYIGLIAETVFVTMGVALLFGGTFPRWFMRAGLAGVLASTVFSYWLFYQELFVIRALCPWCLLLLFSQTLMTFSFWHLMSSRDLLFFSSPVRRKFANWTNSGWGFYLAIIWFILMVGLMVLVLGPGLF
jgi:uncharacterized membrane protein